MQERIFNGKGFADQILETLVPQVKALADPPLLAIILVGDDESSLAYIRQKLRFAEKIGAAVQVFSFKSNISQIDLTEAVMAIQEGKMGEWAKNLTSSTNVDHLKHPSAIIVQRPLPKQIATNHLFEFVSSAKDVDGFHPNSPYLPPVGLAVVTIITNVLKVAEADLKDTLASKNVVIVGSGETAGEPILRTFKHFHIPVTIVTHQTARPKDATRQADILITATGKSHLITKDWIKPGAIVIDVGISRRPSPNDPTKMILAGDCDPSVQEVASVVTPVPGGVGPVNVACLMQNLVTCAAAT